MLFLFLKPASWKNLFSSVPMILCAAALSAQPAYCSDLVVGVPSELAECVEALSSAFLAQEKGVKLRFVTDSSANLYVKMSEGERLDVYMSSDMRLQGQLLADGKMLYDTWTMYATGRIVLWSADKRFDVSKGIGLLSNPAVKKVAVVDASSSYLAPTYAAIGYGGLWKAVQPRLLHGDSMQGLVKAVQAGKAQVAVLSYETVLATPMKGVGRYYLIPVIEYKKDLPGHAAVVTLHGKKNPSALRFISFLKSPKAQAILIPKGFMKPPLESIEVR